MRALERDELRDVTHVRDGVAHVLLAGEAALLRPHVRLGAVVVEGDHGARDDRIPLERQEELGAGGVFAPVAAGVAVLVHEGHPDRLRCHANNVQGQPDNVKRFGLDEGVDDA